MGSSKNIQLNIGQLQFVLVGLFWLLIFAIPLLFGNWERGVHWIHVFKIWKEYSILLLIFLVNRFILMPYLFFAGKRKLYFFSILSLIILSAIIVYLNQTPRPVILSNPMPPLHPEDDPDIMPPGPGRRPGEFIPPYANMIITGILLIGFDSGLLFFNKWMKSEQNMLKAERESYKNRMAFLQNQISPHFFMNTLNNIHALVDIDSNEAKESIIKLSQMMDYMLYESSSGKVSLKQEVDFLNSYVDLMKLRFTDDIKIKLEIPAIIPKVKLPPMLAIVYIENAFKHGISYREPSFIHIRMEIRNNDTIAYKIHNSIHQGKEEKGNSGIGLENTRSRLDMLYGKDYFLEISQSEKSFDVNLEIPI